MNEWSFESALSYFASNTNECLSFSGHFRQSRARLYLCALAKFEGRANKVEDMYMLACAEQNGNARIKNRGFKPTHYRERFIHEVQKTPDDFKIFSRTRNDGILKDMHRLLDQWKAVDLLFAPSDVRSQQVKAIGADLIEFFETPEPTRGSKSKNIPGIDPQDVIELDVTKYQPFTSEYRIFTGLLKAMQGFRTYETVDIFVVDDLNDSFDGLKVAKDVGFVAAQGSGATALDLRTMPEVDLSRFGDVVTLNFD
jgi:hypothetical protein